MEKAGIDLFEAMSTLRSVRRLRADPIPDDLLRKVLTAATWAPNGGNRQGWRFIAVRDAATKKALRDLYLPPWTAYENSHRPAIAKLPDGERERWNRMYDNARHLAEHYHEAPVIVVVCVHLPDLAITDAKLSRPSIVGGGSIYPAVQNLLLAATALGLGSALTTITTAYAGELRALLALPETVTPVAVVPIGWPEKTLGPPRREPFAEHTHRERYGEAW